MFNSSHYTNNSTKFVFVSELSISGFISRYVSCAIANATASTTLLRDLLLISLALLTALLTGCAVTPTTIVKEPLTARAAPRQNNALSSGGIYNPSAYRPLFEDRRPRLVGDIVTINIVENTSATKATGSSAEKDGSVAAGVTSLFGRQAPRTNFAGSSSLSFDEKAAANSSNVFSGSITTTVVDVLPNGNLVVSGEKQISLDRGTEFVRFSGVVNPDTVTLGNFVPSSKVADARIEYRTNSKVDGAQIASMLARFFLSLGPL